MTYFSISAMPAINYLDWRYESKDKNAALRASNKAFNSIINKAIDEIKVALDTYEQPSIFTHKAEEIQDHFEGWIYQSGVADRIILINDIRYQRHNLAKMLHKKADR